MADETASQPDFEFAGEEEFDALFRAEEPGLIRYFRIGTRGKGDPRDLVQEAFLRFMGRANRIVLDNPAAYLNRIARNLLYNHSRDQRARSLRERELDPDFDAPSPALQHRQVEAKQMMARVWEAVDRLPPRMREVFLLHRVEELSYKAIAAKLDISEHTVEAHMSEALFRLRRMMDEE